MNWQGTRGLKPVVVDSTFNPIVMRTIVPMAIVIQPAS
jgi:hypothetical protein